jgi:CheY-like chemotaxis protein
MSSRSYRILVVDDLPDNLFLLQTALEQEGYINQASAHQPCRSPLIDLEP